jgi:DNA-binding MarR family transcriptional regulator
MAINLIQQVFSLPEQSGMTQVTKLVLLKLADNANEQGICWPSHGLIEDQCWLSKSAVKSHIKKLQQSGLLTVQHRKSGTINHSNYYQINIELLRQLTSPENPLGHQATEDGSSDTLPLVHEMTDLGASYDPRTVKEPSVKPSNEPSFFKREKKEATTTKKITVFIDEWQASDDLIMSCLAMSNGINSDINEELEKFKDYYLAKGEARANWDASFRNWLRNAIDRQKNRPAANSRYFNQPLSISDKASQANEAFLNSTAEKPQPDSFVINTTCEVA